MKCDYRKKGTYKLPYKTVDELKKAYEVGVVRDEHWMGMEFGYKGIWYRFCNEFGYCNLYRIQFIDKNGPKYCENLKYTDIASFDNMEEMLQYKLIDNRTVVDILFDKDTDIIDQD